MSDFEKVLDEYKEQTKPMCEALGCIDLLDDFLVDIELSRAKYHHFYQAGQQSQQAKIDELQARIRIYEKHVKAIKHIHETQFDKNTDTSFILGNLDGFIGYLEGDLKGNKDEN